jgi:hypothetical protein
MRNKTYKKTGQGCVLQMENNILFWNMKYEDVNK